MQNTAGSLTYSFAFGIDNCDFTRISGIGLDCQGEAALKVSKCVFESCGGDAIVTSSKASGVSGDVLLDSCYFESNSSYDINLAATGGKYCGRAVVISPRFNGYNTINLGDKSKITLIGAQGQGGAPCTITGSNNAEVVMVGCESTNFVQKGSYSWQEFGSTGSYFQTAPVSYVPTWGSDEGTQPSIGNGAITGFYTRVGKRVSVSVSIRIGTTTALGTTSWYVGLPFAAKNGITQMGTAHMAQTGSADWWGVATVSSGGAAVKSFLSSGGVVNNGNSAVGQTIPFAWSANNIYEFQIDYWTN
jgi:hypothetical protein